MVHDTLSGGLDQNVDFDDVFDRVLQLVAEVASTHNTTVRPKKTGSFGVLPSEYATPLSLALTELVTNAVEHGLAGRDGEVEISARRQDGELSVRVRDDGVGLAEGKVGAGLGTGVGTKSSAVGAGVGVVVGSRVGDSDGVWLGAGLGTTVGIAVVTIWNLGVRQPRPVAKFAMRSL